MDQAVGVLPSVVFQAAGRAFQRASCASGCDAACPGC